MNPERRDNESTTSNRPSEASDPARKALPPAWRTIVSSAPASTWFQVISASGRQLIQDAQTGQLHIMSPHLQLQQTPPEPVSNPSPVQVISWDPSRPWRGPAHQLARLGSPCTCKVSCGARIICHLGVGLGQSSSPNLLLRSAQALCQPQ